MTLYFDIVNKSINLNSVEKLLEASASVEILKKDLAVMEQDLAMYFDHILHQFLKLFIYQHCYLISRLALRKKQRVF